MHRLQIKVSIRSEARILGIPWGLVAGDQFHLVFLFKNVGDSSFPGGDGEGHVKWGTITRYEPQFKFDLPPLAPSQETKFDVGPMTALAEGSCCVFLMTSPGKFESVDLYDTSGRRLDRGNAVAVFMSKTREEIYTLGALILSAASLIVVAAADLPQAIQNISQAFQQLRHFIFGFISMLS